MTAFLEQRRNKIITMLQDKWPDGMTKDQIGAALGISWPGTMPLDMWREGLIERRMEKAGYRKRARYFLEPPR